MWEYVKGSERDFEGAPDEATVLIGGSRLNGRYWAECFRLGAKYKDCNFKGGLDDALDGIYKDGEIIAERRKVNDLQSRTNDANLGEALKEMFKDVPGAKVVIGSGVAPGVHSGPVYDVVQRPAHYNQSGIECIDAIAASMSAEEFQAYLKGNVQKYVWRYQHKNGVEDVRKAQWYLDRLVKELSK